MTGYSLWQVCNNQTLEHDYVKESKGGYLIDFQALNFPHPLLNYLNPRWNIAPAACQLRGLLQGERPVPGC